MPLTPISSATAYATPADMATRYDVRTTGDLVEDDGTQESSANLLTNAKLLALLADASGEVESACLVAGRYTPADLQALTGNSQQFLVGLVCAITAQRLYERRWLEGDDVLPRYEWAQQYLKKLSTGENIFAFAEVAAAGLPKDQFMTDFDFQRLNMVSGVTRFMGTRLDRYPRV